jgi:hypothetical protein
MVMVDKLVRTRALGKQKPMRLSTRFVRSAASTTRRAGDHDIDRRATADRSIAAMESSGCE